MTLRFQTTASLLAALASGQLFGCDASSEDPADPNPSGGGGGSRADDEPRPAPPTTADASFLDAFAETGGFYDIKGSDDESSG